MTPSNSWCLVLKGMQNLTLHLLLSASLALLCPTTARELNKMRMNTCVCFFQHGLRIMASIRKILCNLRLTAALVAATLSFAAATHVAKSLVSIAQTWTFLLKSCSMWRRRCACPSAAMQPQLTPVRSKAGTCFTISTSVFVATSSAPKWLATIRFVMPLTNLLKFCTMTEFTSGSAPNATKIATASMEWPSTRHRRFYASISSVFPMMSKKLIIMSAFLPA
jgi:hypothetical protein